MALRKCPDCGRDISTDAETCPYCGWKSTATKMHETGKAMQSCGLAMTLLITVPLVLIFIFAGM